MNELEAGIAHLDFPIEEKEKKADIRHYAHPTDPEKHWCGEASRYSNYGTASGTVQHALITCVPCLHLFISKGGNWWWEVHRLYYQASCTEEKHNCGHGAK